MAGSSVSNGAIFAGIGALTFAGLTLAYTLLWILEQLERRKK